LCHNSEDKPAVSQIAQTLVKEGTKPWLDEEQIRPGTSGQTALGEQIESNRLPGLLPARDLASPVASARGLTPRAVLDKFTAIRMLDVHFPTAAL
jgi:hypothetical protein